MTFTSSDAEKAFNSGSYKSLTDEELRQLQLACINVVGHNQVNVGRIRIVGEALGVELTERSRRRREHEASGVLSNIEDTGGSLLTSKLNEAPSLWDEARLSRLIRDGVEESFDTEYKRAAALARDARTMAEITKDVSSMANAAGGVIIYGISETQGGRSPERIDPVNQSIYSKEWLEHVISQIRPRISDVRIHPVSLASGQYDVAYVVEIPKGSTAHQATDGRYYRRYNFESVSMLDHEIRDVMNRKTHPRIRVSAEFAIYPHRNSDGNDGVLVFNLLNDSGVLARYIGLVVNAPVKFRDKDIWYTDAVVASDLEGESYKLSFSNHDSAPLFPQANLMRLFPFRFAQVVKPPQKEAKAFRFVLFADSMPKQEGTFTYDEIVSDRYARKIANDPPQNQVPPPGES